MKPEIKALAILSVIIAPLVIVGVILSKTESNAHAMYLFNPHEQTLIVNIDDEQHSLSYREKINIKLTQGKHRFKSVLNDSVLKDTLLTINLDFYNKGGIINMSSQSFYLWKEQYGGETNFIPNIENSSNALDKVIEKEKEKRFKIVQIDTTYLIGNITEFTKNEILVIRDWYYDIDRQFEDEIETYDSSTSIFGKTIGKIFSKEDALAYWKLNYADVLE